MGDQYEESPNIFDQERCTKNYTSLRLLYEFIIDPSQASLRKGTSGGLINQRCFVNNRRVTPTVSDCCPWYNFNLPPEGFASFPLPFSIPLWTCMQLTPLDHYLTPISQVLEKRLFGSPRFPSPSDIMACSLPSHCCFYETAHPSLQYSRISLVLCARSRSGSTPLRGLLFVS